MASRPQKEHHLVNYLRVYQSFHVLLHSIEPNSFMTTFS